MRILWWCKLDLRQRDRIEIRLGRKINCQTPFQTISFSRLPIDHTPYSLVTELRDLCASVVGCPCTRNGTPPLSL
jgi:hypothetical protein